jgi:hypothetical protein
MDSPGRSAPPFAEFAEIAPVSIMQTTREGAIL